MKEAYAVRIQWGYWWWYAQHEFHHSNFSWDGYAMARDGRILECSLIEFGGVFGPQRERFIPLDGPGWRWRPRENYSRLGGVLIKLEGDESTGLEIRTHSYDLKFKIKELQDRKVISRYVGSRYRANYVTAHFDGRDPNLDDHEHLARLTCEDGRRRKLLLATEISDKTQRWFRTDCVWLGPGESIEVGCDLQPEKQEQEGVATALRATLRCIPATGKDGVRPSERTVEPVEIPYRIYLNDSEVVRDTKYFAAMISIPLMDELNVRIPPDLLNGSPVRLKLQNDSDRDYLLLARAFIEEIHERPLELTVCPRWVLLGREFVAAVNCRDTQCGVNVRLPKGVVALDPIPDSLGRGEHRFRFRADEPLAEFPIEFRTDECGDVGKVDLVISAEQERLPMKLGVEDVALPAEDPGLRERIMQHLADTQLGDYMIFRKTLSKEQLVGWVSKCRELGLYCQFAHSIRGEWILEAKRAAGPSFVSWQWTEHDGPLWGYVLNPDMMPVGLPEEQRTMRTAHDDYVAYMRRLVEKVQAVDEEMESWVMISAVGHDAAYRGGMDACISQMNKTHNVLLFADARGAARAHRKPHWGAYMAEGAHLNPEGDHHLRMWWLSLYLAYICGASTANDEETLYRTWHEHLYTHGDRFPRTRRRIMRKFFRYTKTHPRRGRLDVKQAMLIGRYACDSVDGIANSRNEPCTTRVWRNFGGESPEWQPGTPEYGMRYLDVFFPGVWLQSLVQDPETVRWLYSGTPHGELELIPADAPVDVLQDFRLLLLLGWNTMDAALYANLKSYVEGGGTLFMSVPHLTTHEDRTFLRQGVEPLNLFQSGNVEDLFGVRVRGRGKMLEFIRASNGVEQSPLQGIEFPRVRGNMLPPVGPHHDPVHLAEVDLHGAEIIAEDRETGEPILVRHRIGRGEAYLLLTTDFPGNSWLHDFMTELVRGLARGVNSTVSLEDRSGDVYYTARVEDDTELHRIHLLNTDWTEAGNERDCDLSLNGERVPLVVREGTLSEVLWLDELVIWSDDESLFVEEIDNRNGTYIATLHGNGTMCFRLRGLGGTSVHSIRLDDTDVEASTHRDWADVTVTFSDRSRKTLEIVMEAGSG